MRQRIRDVARASPVLAGVLALLALGGQAQAASVYAYAYQRIYDFDFTGATIDTDLLPLSGAGAAIFGSGDAQTGGLDAPQAYAGGGAVPPENTFTPKGAIAPSYARGDAQILSSSFESTSVGEAYLEDTPGTANGTGNWSLSADITIGAGGIITLSFSFDNALSLINDDGSGAVATASNTFTFTITPTGGGDPISVPVVDGDPNLVNQGSSLVSPGTFDTSVVGGTITFSLSGLNEGDTFTATIAGASSAQLTLAAVPEPSTIALAGMGAVGAGVFGLKRRRRPTA